MLFLSVRALKVCMAVNLRLLVSNNLVSITSFTVENQSILVEGPY